MSPRARAALACALVAFALALPSLRNGFVLDDAYLVVARAPSLQRAAWFFVEPWGGGAGGLAHARVNAAYYRPLTETLFAVEHSLFGLRAWGWHLTSALLHALATALCALLIARVARRDSAALAGGLLFAVMPAHVEAVAAVCYQTTLLAAMLALASLVALGRAFDGDGKRLIARSAVLAALATFAKEEAAVVPLFAVAWAILERPRVPARRAAITCGAVILAVIPPLIARALVTTPSRVTYFAGQPPSAIVWTMLSVPALYLELLIAPVRLCVFYDWFIVPFRHGFDLSALRGIAIVLAFVGLIVWCARKQQARAIAIGLLWLALGLLPVMQLVPILNVAAERFLYLPSVGWALALGVAITFARARAPRAVSIVGALVLALYAARSVVRTLDFHDDDSVDRATARDFPETPTPWLNLADRAIARGDRDAARDALSQAQRCAPGWDLPARKLKALDGD